MPLDILPSALKPSAAIKCGGRRGREAPKGDIRANGAVLIDLLLKVSIYNFQLMNIDRMAFRAFSGEVDTGSPQKMRPSKEIERVHDSTQHESAL
jgi:hypothetical protein